MKHNETILDLGEHYVSEFVGNINNSHVGLKFPLKLIWDDKVQCPVLSEQPPHDMMWGKYWYRSGINPTMVKDLKDVVDSINKLVEPPTDKGKIWLDIASNDGTLLNEVNKNYMKIGIDPCKGEIADMCRENSNFVVEDYFSEKTYDSLELSDKASIITCCAMFQSIKYPMVFLEDVANVLADDGVFVLQLIYTPYMLAMGDFMNVCHENYAYHYFENVYDMMVVNGIQPFMVEFNEVNGGSIRIYADKSKRPIDSSVYETLQREAKIDKRESWKMFKQVVEMNRFKLVDFVKLLNKNGHSVWGYGASTKGNTLLQWYGLDSDEIFRIADVNKLKEGRYTKGSAIKITSEKEWRDAKVDYTFILPFQYKDYILEKEKDYLNNGGVFIVACPSPCLISKNGIEYI